MAKFFSVVTRHKTIFPVLFLEYLRNHRIIVFGQLPVTGRQVKTVLSEQLPVVDRGNAKLHLFHQQFRRLILDAKQELSIGVNEGIRHGSGINPARCFIACSGERRL